MSEQPIRVVVVDADLKDMGARPGWAGEIPGIEVVGVAYDRSTALAQVQELRPDVLMVDLMLPGMRSIDLVRQVTSSQLQVRILAVAPDDPPHDRIMLAAAAGALGFITRHAPFADYKAAIERVHGGEPWLPQQPTYVVLQDGAGELDVSSQARQARLTGVLLGLIPLTGFVAAITADLWRRYWGHINVRVADLGVDPTSRMIDVLFFFVAVIGIFGPLLFVRPWVQSLGRWIQGEPQWAGRVAKARSLHLGKLPVGELIVNQWVARLLGMLLVLSFTLLLTKLLPLIMALVVGPAVAIGLMANVLDLDDELPGFLHVPHLDSWRVLAFVGLILIVFLLALSAEVLIIGPDLRADGLHGILAPRMLGFRATPVMVYDQAENQEPWGALFLGSQGDLYVVYDPCTEEVSYLSVSSTAHRIALIDRVDCPSQ